MLENIPLTNILFLDIETVPQHSSFDDVPKGIQQLWEKKSKYLIKDDKESPDSIYRQAGLYAEFGKVVCISCGYFSADRKLRIKSFYGDDEKNVLTEFSEMLSKFFSKTPERRSGERVLRVRRRRRPPRLETGEHASLPSPHPFSR